MCDMPKEHLSIFQQYALVYHSINLKHGFVCTGFQEDDPPSQSGIVKLPDDWPLSNSEVASFRYTHPAAPSEEFYFKSIQAADKIEINALSSAKNNEIHSTEFTYDYLSNV